jgi:endonuclease/exonuclease/phosphatase family metal-dependent hydrolase
MTRIQRQPLHHTESVQNSIPSCPDNEALSTAQSRRLGVRLITHNIRYATDFPFTGEERWQVRRPRLASELVFNSVVPATFICLQEVLHSQLLDIKADLNASTSGEWAYIGVGRDDGKEAGEYSPIFYRPSVWVLKRWHTVWLSETPKFPSKGWDASSTRIATMGFFKHIQTGHTIIVTSTHFDDQGAVSRKKSAELLLTVLEFEQQMAGYNTSLLGGDFNSTPEEEAYQVLTSPESAMIDVAKALPLETRYGNEITFTGFSDESTPSRIDFIFARKEDIGKTIAVTAYAVLANRFDDDVYSSDHRACVADFNLMSE